jgi:hypothetical protein
MATDDTRTDGRPWLRYAVLLVGLVLVLLLGWLLAVTLVTRWWAQWLGNRVDGRITVGTAYGLTFGFLCTLLPLGVARQSLRDLAWKLRAAVLVLALVLAAPNLVTLSIALGTGSGAHAGDRILDVEGPGFRVGTALGAGAAVLVFAAFVLWSIGRWRDQRVVQRLKARD